MSVLLSSLLKDQEKYVFNSEFCPDESSCILDTRFTGSATDDFPHGKCLQLKLNEGHEFTLKQRTEGSKEHVKKLSNKDEEFKIFGRHYKKQDIREKIWTGKVTVAGVEQDFIIPNMDLE
jgi:hypothetical protein